jgi:hypothetical protein
VLSEHGLGPERDVPGFVSVEDIVAQTVLGNFQMAGDGTLDFSVISAIGDAEFRQRKVETAALETDMSNRGAIHLNGHDGDSSVCRIMGENNPTVNRTSLRSFFPPRFVGEWRGQESNLHTFFKVKTSL